MTNKALILIDFQKEWADPKSPDFVGDLISLLERTNTLIDFCRKQGYKIIFTRHVEKNSTAQWSENSKGAELLDKIHQEFGDVLITKHKINPFYETSMESELQCSTSDVEHSDLVVCGILTNNCVRSFIADAYDRNFNITVIKDCCATFDNETQEFTFKDLGSTREEIRFINLNDFLDT
ncbi:MAG: cysteine hydrolase [Candidatus Vogelbacteria bacterium]|nr:cysteine hydrolase [Candidatus Vogelbacteria bacterium]